VIHGFDDFPQPCIFAVVVAKYFCTEDESIWKSYCSVLAVADLAQIDDTSKSIQENTLNAVQTQVEQCG